jgi:hypothetical protein
LEGRKALASQLNKRELLEKRARIELQGFDGIDSTPKAALVNESFEPSGALKR